MTTDPTTIAREVLDIQEAHEGLCKRTGLALPVSMDDMATLAGVAPALARAVLRVVALADELDREASEHMDRPVHSRSGTRIRAALNGDNAWSTRPTTAHGTTGSPGDPCGPTGTAGDGSCR